MNNFIIVHVQLVRFVKRLYFEEKKIVKTYSWICASIRNLIEIGWKNENYRFEQEFDTEKTQTKPED